MIDPARTDQGVIDPARADQGVDAGYGLKIAPTDLCFLGYLVRGNDKTRGQGN